MLIEHAVAPLRAEEQQVLLKWDTAPAREGRFARTAWLALLAAGWSSSVFRHANDPVLVAPFFALMGLAVTALGYELNSQANRRASGGSDQWTRTDTGIVLVLVGYVIWLGLSAALASLPGNERSAAASFATLYLVLAACFSWARRRTVAQA